MDHAEDLKRAEEVGRIDGLILSKDVLASAGVVDGALAELLVRIFVVAVVMKERLQ